MIRLINANWTKCAEIDCKVEDLPYLLPLYGVDLPVNGRRVGDNVAWAWGAVPVASYTEMVSIAEVCSND